MKTLHLSLIILIVIIFLGFGLQSAHADDANSMSIQNIKVQPSMIKVGDTFTVTATLVNNSTFPIFVSNMISKDCQGPFFTVSFDNHVKVEVTAKDGMTCSYVGLQERLDPNKKYTGTSPGLFFTYTTTHSGTANVTVTFPYKIKNQTDPNQSNIDQTISKSFLFTIYDSNTNSIIPTYGGGGDVVAITLDPLGQFKSGIPAKNITCQKDFVLVIKSEDASPACVYASHAAQLLIRGWAESENQKTNLQNTIKVTGSDSSVTYDITGGKLLGIVRDSQGERLFIPIQSNTDGNVKLTLPRSVIDTNPDYKNDTFYIMTNSGSIGIFDETDTPTERTVTIPFEKGDNMIQISVMSWVKEMASTGLGLNKTVTNTICDVPYDPGTGHSSPLYDNGTILHTGYTPVLYMPIDSTGKICVQYYHSASQSNVGARVFDANNLANDTNNVSISSLQNTIMTGNTTVVYTVNTGHKAGFYGVSFFCGGQAFAVGYDNQSRIVLDDFPWYGQTFFCPLQTYEYKITGLHNIGVYHIKTVSHEQLLYDITNTTVTSVHLTPTSQNVTFSLHVRSFDKPVDFVFDYKDSLIDQFKTNPGFEKSFDVCNWNVANRDLVGSFPWLRLGQISVSDIPVTFKPWSNGTYTFSIIAKGLDDGYYGLNPVVYGRPAGVSDDNTGINYVAYDYPVTIGLGSNVDPSGVCNR
ncbi:MAG: hypothetical protein PXX83_09475 [Candidatus Nitrosotalea sp.]|nr:hypothetical protein [Candidatus Nitrosotalea sp.]